MERTCQWFRWMMLIKPVRGPMYSHVTCINTFWYALKYCQIKSLFQNNAIDLQVWKHPYFNCSQWWFSLDSHYCLSSLKQHKLKALPQIGCYHKINNRDRFLWNLPLNDPPAECLLMIPNPSSWDRLIEKRLASKLPTLSA